MSGNDLLDLAEITGAMTVVSEVTKAGGSIIATAVTIGGIPAGLGATVGAVLGGTVAIVTSPAVLTLGAIVGGAALLKKIFK